MPKPKRKPTVAERIAERLFDAKPAEHFVLRLAQKIPGPNGETEWGGWCKESVIRVINEELKKAAKPLTNS